MCAVRLELQYQESSLFSMTMSEPEVSAAIPHMYPWTWSDWMFYQLDHTMQMGQLIVGNGVLREGHRITPYDFVTAIALAPATILTDKRHSYLTWLSLDPYNFSYAPIFATTNARIRKVDNKKKKINKWNGECKCYEYCVSRI